jgi:hypothetical protein
MEIKIGSDVLSSVRSMKEDQALQIIDQTAKVRIEGNKPVDVKRVEKGIVVDVPTNLDHGPLVIILMNREGKTLALLGYDQKAEEFLRQEDKD